MSMIYSEMNSTRPSSQKKRNFSVNENDFDDPRNVEILLFEHWGSRQTIIKIFGA